MIINLCFPLKRHHHHHHHHDDDDDEDENHHHHHHRRKKRRRRKKILVHDLETQRIRVSYKISFLWKRFSYNKNFSPKEIDPEDLSQKARWTIIATACLLLLMCLMLVGITLRMAPIIDEMGKD